LTLATPGSLKFRTRAHVECASLKISDERPTGLRRGPEREPRLTGKLDYYFFFFFFLPFLSFFLSLFFLLDFLPMDVPLPWLRRAPERSKGIQCR
jgi:hypothetical protein